nr:MAG TPA: hypothetical protein [Caudoviricetes sp.]
MTPIQLDIIYIEEHIKSYVIEYLYVVSKF